MGVIYSPHSPLLLFELATFVEQWGRMMGGIGRTWRLLWLGTHPIHTVATELTDKRRGGHTWSGTHLCVRAPVCHYCYSTFYTLHK